MRRRKNRHSALQLAFQAGTKAGTSNAGFGISDDGIITGRGLLNGVVTGFVMVPVPEPASLGAAVVSFGALLRRRR